MTFLRSQKVRIQSMEVEDHYAILLGINYPWEITKVDLNPDKQ